MVNKRGELIEKLKLVLSVIFLISVFALIAYFVLAAGFSTTTLQSPMSGGNYSSYPGANSTSGSGSGFGLNFTCLTNMSAAVNATILHNASGGAATSTLRLLTNLTEGIQGADTNVSNVTAIGNASLNVSALADGRQYNITCVVVNNSNYTTYASAVNVTIDNTPPVVGAFVLAGGNYSNLTYTDIIINVSITDTGVGVKDVFINISNLTGVVNATLNFSKAKNVSGSYFNYTINTSALKEGRYNVTIYANDTINNSNNPATTKITITVDGQSPNVSVVTASLNNTNKSGSFNINVTATDTLTRVGYVNFSLVDLDTATKTLNATASLISGNIWGVGVSTTSIPDGNYTINASVYDYAGNVNSSAANVTFKIDNTAPTITYSCSATTITQGSTLTCTCVANDYGSAVDNSTISKSSYVTTSTGSFTTTCTAYDYAGNKGTSAAVAYNVISSGGGPGASTAAPVVITTVGTLTSEQLTSGYTRDLSKGQQVTFKVADTNHYAGVLAVTTTTALINVSSTAQQKTLSVGDVWKVELTNDTFYDLSVKLNSIANNKANVTIKSIHEEIPAAPSTPETTPSTTEQITEAVKSNLTTIIIVIVIIIVVALVIFFLYKKKKK
jgi:hypothetical protein